MGSLLEQGLFLVGKKLVGRFTVSFKVFCGVGAAASAKDSFFGIMFLWKSPRVLCGIFYRSGMWSFSFSFLS